jgi:hypothetical protein
MTTIVYLNGQFVPGHEAKVSLFDQRSSAWTPTWTACSTRPAT